jgi:plastocyanin
VGLYGKGEKLKKVIALGALGAAMIVLVFASIAVAQSSPDQVQSPDSSGQAAPAQDTITVNIHDHAFDPAQLNAAPGTTVTWVNGDTEAHTATADNGLFDSGVLNPGDFYSVWLDGSGTVTYHCDIHPDMQGSVVVGGPVEEEALPQRPLPLPLRFVENSRRLG